MGKIKEYLKDKGFNMRERANMYAGLALPPLLMTSFFYFVGLNGRPNEESLETTTFKFGLALLGNIPFAVGEFATGAYFGVRSATKLRDERNLENTIV